MTYKIELKYETDYPDISANLEKTTIYEILRQCENHLNNGSNRARMLGMRKFELSLS